ncbi:putative Alpha/Beta hydrolase protein [Monocercomonoides exilis]|uniref:putative Alpha/Beta hydrolase protein n=1 Tax=Monocercomonoides exilis TaxID=2049356 RepID=UPI00355ABEEE|nr:putative Alpha/Beta hydrolase protein [Monocercomonoides exilis]|eukprot:MONOS_12050.1-p1 / transcript=MONOS_12050.1 / gene=MONOS_12050 / organism=Monocercomonoides_exilis_PA203 / gene_product=hydrolase, alpha / transcript_product=hydrolase, alpha / location=Mono_scaffold00640:1644-2897(-) / protein_length=342 / sequence_SO=supercontig / SO=protein_coding / is_pseudo=false
MESSSNLLIAPLSRLDKKTGKEAHFSQRQRQAIRRNGIFSMEKKGVELYYELYGEGKKKVIFVCGLGDPMDDWRRTVLSLLMHEEFEICLFNNRGVRESKFRNVRLTTSQMASDVVELAKFLGWEKINICGFSMGGFIVTELICLKPDLLESAIIVGGSSGRFFPSSYMFKNVSKMLLSRNEEDAREILYKTKISDYHLEHPHPEFGGETGLEFIKRPLSELPFPEDRPPIHTLFAHCLACWTHYVSLERLNEAKKKIDYPILVIHGTDDKIVPFSHGEYIAKHLDAQFYPFHNCGHIVFIEETEKFNDLVTRFFLNLPLPSNEKSIDKLSSFATSQSSSSS